MCATHTPSTTLQRNVPKNFSKPNPLILLAVSTAIPQPENWHGKCLCVGKVSVAMQSWLAQAFSGLHLALK